MSILIKGMEMPTSFEECQTVLGCCDAFEDGTVWCRLAHGYIGDERTVCPIVPVPPHGRLVDMGEIEERIDSCCDDIDCSKTMCNECAVQIVMNKVFDAPTIIPAEEGET